MWNQEKASFCRGHQKLWMLSLFFVSSSVLSASSIANVLDQYFVIARKN